ncbi:MAG: phosphinothricin acetyltransferase [Qipengyuania sp.]
MIGEAETVSSILIRAAEPARDGAGCAAIYRPFVTDTWVSFEQEPPDTNEMARRIGECSASHAWLVAEIGDALAGYAYAGPHRLRAAYASSCDVAVYVAPTHQGRGVGKALYGELLPSLAGRYHAAFAGIALPNDASIGLHEALGFTKIGVYREVGWKLGDWRDVAWWQRRL